MTSEPVVDDEQELELEDLPFFDDDAPAEPLQQTSDGSVQKARGSWVDAHLDNLEQRRPPAGYLPTTRQSPGRRVPSQPAPEGLDWSLVAAFRARASAQLTEAMKTRDSFGADEQRSLGRQIIGDLLEGTAQDDLSSGRTAWSAFEQQRLAEAVFDALFNLGRLQPLVDEADIEDIEIRGQGDQPVKVVVETSDGVLHDRPPVADNDADLIEFVSFLASRSEVNARAFSPAQPRLHLRLDGGARLAAAAWTTPHPIVIIRRHRLRDVTLSDLSMRGMITPLCASFLAACVRAGYSIVVSGAQKAGKTTTVRALCNEIPYEEHIGTFETEYELFLNEMPHRHKRVSAFEARPGSGERGWDGRQAGEITLLDLLYDSFRFSLARQIVGEIRGPEVLAMIKAMQSGNGSISTTHARNARGAIDKLITCALEAGPQITPAYAERSIAAGIDIVVHVNLDTRTDSDGATHRLRYISEVIAVEPSGDGWKATDVFTLDPTRRVSVPNVLPDHLRELQAHGFDLAGFQSLARDIDGPREPR